MLDQGIIEESSSPWMAPAVYTRKKSGDLIICVDYHELNKRTKKDSYSLPLVDEVQDHLAESAMFSTLDLQSGYWQIPVSQEDREKTTFSPGAGLGLYQFTHMPFGLTNAPSTFQCMMDTLFRGLPFVSVLVHSSTEEEHKLHLQEVFNRLREAGLILHGPKCHISLPKVTYLGHVFSKDGMAPDPHKICVVQDWPIPSNVENVRHFLGLASYYRRYIHQFSNVAAPLHQLTHKNQPFCWTNDCHDAFVALKSKLINAPILVYPQLQEGAQEFVLMTHASSVGLGAILEQDGAYASRALSQAEKQYSVIQKECLAIVYATKQFRHYLLGWPFKILTDHAPLQWLSAQKMEGICCVGGL